VRDDLRGVADDVWAGLTALAEGVGEADPLDDARRRYDALYDAARVLVHDAIVAEATLARRAGARVARKQARSQPANGSGSRARAFAKRLLRR